MYVCAVLRLKTSFLAVMHVEIGHSQLGSHSAFSEEKRAQYGLQYGVRPYSIRIILCAVSV